MMDRLPQLIDPIRLTSRSERLSGQIAPADLSRLLPMLASPQGRIEVELEFGVDIARIRTIQGKVSAQLKLKCQRCLETMDSLIDFNIKLGIIKAREQADRLPAQYEPLLVETEEISLQDIIEDELILAMPGAPVHDIEKDNDICKRDTKYLKDDSVVESVAEHKRKNPFAVLAELKEKAKD